MTERIFLHSGGVLEQNARCFALSQDTVLLSSFISLKPGERALDVGCGSGALALLVMLAFERTAVDGLDISADAVTLAQKNYRANKKDGALFACDFSDPPAHLAQAYDVCMSNPPYFDLARGKAAPVLSRALARSRAALSLEGFLRSSAYVLRQGGRLYFCQRAEYVQQIMAAASAVSLAVKRLRFVHHGPGYPASIALIECRKGGGAGAAVLPPLFITGPDNQKTAEYRGIYRMDGE